MREIKFRAWNEAENKMYSDIEDIRPRYKVHLMQFTGLKDKNGKEICEGDIVSFLDADEIRETTMNGEVKFNPQQAGFYISYQKHKKNYYRLFNVTYGDGETYMDESIEVISTIYENPELLK